MQADKIVIQNNAQNKNQKIQMQPNQKKIEPIIQKPVLKSEKKQPNLMKLYVYGSCQSDQFRHPNKLSQSKRPVCITNIQKFDLNEQQDQQQQATNKALNIYINPLFKKNIYKIACGGLHSVVLTSDGKAYTFGCNDEGALGRKGPQCIPMQVPLDCPVDLVSAGDNHSMFANSINGVVFFTGNYNYLRGQKMIQSVKQPIKFTTVSIDIRNKNHPIQKLQSGANHTVILVNNRIFCRGQPQSFTTGRRINQRRKTDSSLTFDGVGLTHVLDVWCGGYHTVAKVKKGKDFLYYTWGKNDQGQLGIGNFKSQAFPVQIKGLRARNVIKAAAGGFFTLFLTQSGQILGCGTNQYGQLGLGEDYQFVSSQPQSEQQDNQDNQKSGELEKVVEGLKISDIDKQKMISQSQQKVLPDLPNITVEQPKIQKPAEQQVQKKKYEQQNTYIKSVRPLVFPEQVTPKSIISNISAGAEFAFAWNNLTQLYSWGFGMNYVLLNGEQNEQYEPFKVRNKIFNDQIIQQVKAGGQHVLYTAYEKSQDKNKPNLQLDKRVTELLVPEKGKLSRKRKIEKINLNFKIFIIYCILDIIFMNKVLVFNNNVFKSYNLYKNIKFLKKYFNKQRYKNKGAVLLLIQVVVSEQESIILFKLTRYHHLRSLSIYQSLHLQRIHAKNYLYHYLLEFMKFCQFNQYDFANKMAPFKSNADKSENSFLQAHHAPLSI